MRRISMPLFFLFGLAAFPAIAAPTVSTITTTATSNGTTLPFQRHVIRVGPSPAGQGELVAALQRQGTGGEGLVLFLSRDDGRTWTESLPVQNDPSERDTADLLADPDGSGFALLYSLEPMSSMFAVDPRSTVVFLHYAVNPDLSIQVDTGPIVVYSPGAHQGYFRGSLARDTTGTLHATASLLDASSGTAYSWWESMSTNNGTSWSTPIEVAKFGSSFGGGRVTPYGDRLIAIYDDYSVADEGRYRTKAAGPSATWGSEGVVEPLGLYHAGAFSVTSTPDGNVHLGYSDKPLEQLWYREFNGSSWSSATLMESNGTWSNQPAVSHVGNTVLFSWNHSDTATDMIIRQATKPPGGAFGSATTVDSVALFKGYTSALENLTQGESLAVLWSQDPASSGEPSNIQCGLVSGLSDVGGSGDAGVPDAGSGGADAGGEPADAGSGTGSDAGASADAGSSDAGSGAPVSDSDSFASCTSSTDLGAGWTISGRWYCKSGHARGETAGGIALAETVPLGDTKVSAAVQLDGSTGSGVLARATGSGAYAAVLNIGTGVQIQAIHNGTTSVLASGSASIADETSYTLELIVTGTNPVKLQAYLNGSLVAVASDSSGSAFASGASGLLSGTSSRSQYAKFVLTGTSAP
jgi:hypothetical protein